MRGLLSREREGASIDFEIFFMRFGKAFGIDVDIPKACLLICCMVKYYSSRAWGDPLRQPSLLLGSSGDRYVGNAARHARVSFVFMKARSLRKMFH